MKDEIVLYQPNEELSLEVKVENDTVWLNRNQMAVLFDRDVKTIGKHINNTLREELAPTVAKNATLQNDNPTHDRFMIIDDVVYHIGASLKDLGKAWFAFTKMNDISANELLARIK